MCGTWPPSVKLDFQRKRIWTVGEPIIYTPTKFRENIFIGGIDMPPKQNPKKALWRQNSTSGSNFDNCHPLGTFLCIIIHNFFKNCSMHSWVIAIQLFLHMPLNLRCQWHNDTVSSCKISIRLWEQMIDCNRLHWMQSITNKNKDKTFFKITFPENHKCKFIVKFLTNY